MDSSSATTANDNHGGNDGVKDYVNVTTSPQLENKRALENGESGEDLGFRSAKKAKEMQRVAEIVLVLSALAGMRGGKSPTEAEVRLMEEARAKLVDVCQDLKPNDLVARDAIGTVIDDLGLNWKLKDQRLGQFRGPASRISIKDKISFAKKKMEDSKKFTASSATYTSQMPQPSFSATAEVRGQSHSIHMFSTDKHRNPPLNSALGHVSAATSTSVTHHPVTSEVRASTASMGISNNHLGRDSSVFGTNKVEKSNFKVDGELNGTSYAPKVQANASANQPMVSAPTWSLQSHSVSLNKATPENKVLNHNVSKAEGATNLATSQAASRAARDQVFRPVIPQSPSTNLQSIHQSIQGIKYVQPSFLNNHSEIAKIIQKLLQPKLPEHPTWIPPSRDYMNKPSACQMCKVAASEVDTVVLCDACEKAFHLKCLETVNQKGIPRAGEWHCLRCTFLANGKPLPPKYGRVMRSITPPKGPSNPSGAQTSAEKKNVDQKVNQEKLVANGSSGLQSPALSGTVTSTCAVTTSDMIASNSREITRNGVTSSMNNIDQETSGGNFPNSTKSLGSASSSPLAGLSGESLIQPMQVSGSSIQDEKSVSESKFQSRATLSENITKEPENPMPSNNLQNIDGREFNEFHTKTSEDSCMFKESESTRGHSDCPSTLNVKQSEQDVNQTDSACSSEANDEARKHAGVPPNGVNVEWIGDVVKFADGKKFYESCSIDGVTYKVQGHALFCSSHEKLMPSRLQAMWEEIETGSKWVTVCRCYFPGDLPEAVGHPCAPESNEVYESNVESSIIAGLIQGPCKVFPPPKFQENSDGQSHLGTDSKNEPWPVFLCKWFYDASKGNFQPVFN